MKTEDDVRQALRGAAESISHQDLLATLPARRRRRTVRRLAAVVVAVAVASTAGALAFGGGGRAPQVVTPQPTPEGRLLRAVHPKAFGDMPAKDPSGLPYQPVLAIDARRVLVRAGERLEVYTSGRFEKVAEVKGEIKALAADGGSLAWLSEGEIRVVPLGGGKSWRIAEVDELVNRIGINGERVVWSSPRGGVWQSVAGGRPELLHKGLQLLRWPWATDEPLDPKANVTRIVDLTIGYDVQVKAAPGVTGLRCGPFWCAGSRGAMTIVQRTNDWSDLREVREVGPSYPIFNRFLNGGFRIYDIETDETLHIDRTRLNGGETLIYWQEGDRLVVVNLAAIPELE
ncbi:hypothetical protein [Nonomuraea soli]|uniref:Uncharacterized protein n=1 Tax=Nonomuraea soli TaxID=1032476 RepID=A0A7W0CI98_9ACTN|nr:hypothetical protein [Nonomuraea soli]MBA2891631.1 hypothetical protein [Nonomuraea soli]